MRKTVAIVVLAAGRSTRMGRSKQLLEINGKSLLRRTAETAIASNADAVVVTLEKGDKAISSELNDLELIHAEVENPELGQSISIKAALRVLNNEEIGAALFTPCDLPLLTTAHLNALIEAYKTGASQIVASRYEGVPGAPMLLDRSLWPELMELRGDVGARKIVARHGDKTVAIDWEDGKFDLDTPEDWARFNAKNFSG